jgi:hypothetical protein
MLCGEEIPYASFTVTEALIEQQAYPFFAVHPVCADAISDADYQQYCQRELARYCP